MVDDDRLLLLPGEIPALRRVRFRTLGCYLLSDAIQSSAAAVRQIIEELRSARVSERQGRVINHDDRVSMERKKQEGYF